VSEVSVLTYRHLVEGIQAVLYVDAHEDRSSNLYTSPQIEALLGFTVEQWRVDPALWVDRIHEDDRDAGRDGAREIAGMYLANKVQNIQGAADTLLDLANIDVEEILEASEAVIGLGRYRGRVRGTGRPVTAAFCHVFRVRAGRVVKVQQFTDTAQFKEP